VTELCQILKTVDMTVPRTGATVFELRQRLMDARLELTLAIKSEVGGFKVMEQKPGIRNRRCAQ
jgi:hypothetical protein